jgi:hypothetical protein
MIHTNAMDFHRYDILIIPRQTKTQEAKIISKHKLRYHIQPAHQEDCNWLLLLLPFPERILRSPEEKMLTLKLRQKHFQLATISHLTFIGGCILKFINKNISGRDISS